MRYIVFSLLLCFVLSGEGSFSATPNKVLNTTVATFGVSADSDLNDDLSAVVPNHSQTVANAFRHFKQQNPQYGLLVEFLAENWSAALYKHLIDSGENEPWYVYNSFSPKRQRISGWKDANLLYKKGFRRAA